ncbi:MAG: response regulator [Fibromonadales bacterium]|nr:response regulator [Fibromonadales bacterium]
MENTHRKIIYVDDVKFSLMSLKNRLKERYNIYPVQSVSKLFEILENVEPDLILLDVNMPGVDGFGAIQQLKTDDRYAKIPVIFLTSRDDERSVRDGIKLGAVDYVRKPFSEAELIERIENQFNSHLKNEVILPKIIYVDDVNYNLLSVRNRLKMHYTIYPAQSVQKLFEILEKLKTDLILLDIDMPGMNGFDAIKELKADSRYADIPVIFLTGRDDEGSVVDGIKLGAIDYVRKPFSDTELIKRIDYQLIIKNYWTGDEYQRMIKKYGLDFGDAATAASESIS